MLPIPDLPRNKMLALSLVQGLVLLLLWRALNPGYVAESDAGRQFSALDIYHRLAVVTVAGYVFLRLPVGDYPPPLVLDRGPCPRQHHHGMGGPGAHVAWQQSLA